MSWLVILAVNLHVFSHELVVLRNLKPLPLFLSMHTSVTIREGECDRIPCDFVFDIVEWGINDL